MNDSILFDNEFTINNLNDLFKKRIQANPVVGVDGIKMERFENEDYLEKEIMLIIRKVRSKNYSFIPYKCICKSKGINKYPRVIEIPSIRDRITLRALCNILGTIYSETMKRRHLHVQVSEVIKAFQDKKYNFILRYDVKNFYPSILHDILFQQLSENIKSKEVLSLIRSAIENSNDITKTKGKNVQGVPQGLSISNILSNIYLSEFDKQCESKEDFQYFRFVDDILIFCNDLDYKTVDNQINQDIRQLGLEFHSAEKQCKQLITDKFDYLGYLFDRDRISVRPKSVDNLRSNIINLLCSYKYKKDFLTEQSIIFKINLHITGCISAGKQYGWLFYYSNINDEKLLHSLDHFVKKQASRFGIQSKKIKKFVRAWKEINCNIHETRYIPNFDFFTEDEKKDLLQLNNFKEPVSKSDIDKNVLKCIQHEINSIRKDINEYS